MTDSPHRKPLTRPVPGWVLAVAVWLAMLATMGVAGPFTGGDWPAATGDDAMRVVEVRDLLDGQAWTDLVQHRDNTPFGAEMHWSRLVDLPLAGLALVLRPVYGADAIHAAATLWPPLLLLPFVALAMTLAGRLGARAAPLTTAFVLLTAPMVHTEFAPGRVDHHNVQMVLILGLMLATMLGRQSRAAAIAAGLLAATCIAIGLECLPAVMAALFFFPLFWVDGARAARCTIAFATAFAAGLAGHLILVSDFTSLWQPACDALSITYVWAGISYAAATTIAVAAGRNLVHPLPRFGLAAAAAVAALAATAILFPVCLGGPYAELDADLAAALLTDFAEALPAWRWLAAGDAEISVLIVLPVVGLATALIMARIAPPGRRMDWLVLAGFAVVLVIVMLAQVRGVRLAQLPALPACGALIAWLWWRARERLGPARIVALVAGIVASAGALHLIAAYIVFPVGTPPGGATALHTCLLPRSYDRLAALPPGGVVAYHIVGPQILLRTPHSIVTAGYHRNEQGLRDLIRFVAGGENEALAVARERRLDYLVLCKDVPIASALHGVPAFAGVTPQARWSWLTPLSAPDEALQIYAIGEAAR